jgi:hypothetical protein
MADALLPIAVIAIMAVILLAIIRLFETMAFGRMIKAAMRDHPESIPLLVDKIGTRRPISDALAGWLLLALAVAMLIYAGTTSGEEQTGLAKAAIFPAILGATIIAYLRISNSRKSAG